MFNDFSDEENRDPNRPLIFDEIDHLLLDIDSTVRSCIEGHRPIGISKKINHEKIETRVYKELGDALVVALAEKEDLNTQLMASRNEVNDLVWLLAKAEAETDIPNLLSSNTDLEYGSGFRDNGLVSGVNHMENSDVVKVDEIKVDTAEFIIDESAKEAEAAYTLMQQEFNTSEALAVEVTLNTPVKDSAKSHPTTPLTATMIDSAPESVEKPFMSIESTVKSPNPFRKTKSTIKPETIVTSEPGSPDKSRLRSGSEEAARVVLKPVALSDLSDKVAPTGDFVNRPSDVNAYEKQERALKEEIARLKAALSKTGDELTAAQVKYIQFSEEAKIKLKAEQDRNVDLGNEISLLNDQNAKLKEKNIKRINASRGFAVQVLLLIGSGLAAVALAFRKPDFIGLSLSVLNKTRALIVVSVAGVLSFVVGAQAVKNIFKNVFKKADATASVKKDKKEQVKLDEIKIPLLSSAHLGGGELTPSCGLENREARQESNNKSRV